MLTTRIELLSMTNQLFEASLAPVDWLLLFREDIWRKDDVGQLAVILVDHWTFSSTLICNWANDEANRSKVFSFLSDSVEANDFLVLAQGLVVNLNIFIAKSLIARIEPVDIGTILLQEVKADNALSPDSHRHLLDTLSKNADCLVPICDTSRACEWSRSLIAG